LSYWRWVERGTFGVVPDPGLFGKAMGNGFPILCDCGHARMSCGLFEDVFFSFTHGGERREHRAASRPFKIAPPLNRHFMASRELLQERNHRHAGRSRTRCLIRCAGLPPAPGLFRRIDSAESLRCDRCSRQDSSAAHSHPGQAHAQPGAYG